MTGIAQRLEADWDHLTARLRHQSATTEPSDSSQQEEQPMATPQQPQRNLFADVASAMTEVAANPLMVRLACERLGEQLGDSDIEHVAGLVRSIESSKHAVAAAVAAKQQAEQQAAHDGSTQFPPAEQQQ